MHCLLIGNFGVGNFGDEALKEYFLSAFPEVQWTVVSSCHPELDEGRQNVMVRRAHHDTVPRLPLGLRSLFTPWHRTIIAFHRAEAVVFGGGSLFTDSESSFACVLWGWHAFWAWIFRKPIILAFQGIGPFHTVLGEVIARWVCRNAAFISVRDHLSYNRVNGWLLNKKIVQTFDPVFSLLQKDHPHDSSQNVLIVIPRNNSGATLRESVKKTIEQDDFSAVRILLLQPGDPKEKMCAESIRSSLSTPTTIVPIHVLSDLTQSLVGASFVLSERYHGALAALAVAVPVDIITQAKGDKLDSLKDCTKKDLAELRALVEIGEQSFAAFLKRHGERVEPRAILRS